MVNCLYIQHQQTPTIHRDTSQRDTHNVHTVTLTSWYKVSPEITIIKHGSSIIYEEQHLPIQLDTKLTITYTSHHGREREREMNHIATGRALGPEGELLPPHHRRQQRRWRDLSQIYVQRILVSLDGTDNLAFTLIYGSFVAR
jgi:hypothetical protein